MNIRTGEYKERIEELQVEVGSLRSQIRSQITVLPSAIAPKILSDFLVDIRIKVLEDECPLASLTFPFSSSSPVPTVASNVISQKALQVLKEHDKDGKSQLVCCYASGSDLHGNKGTTSAFLFSTLSL
jgi:hypothetical protein